MTALLPPFLARLQANNASRDGRQEFNVARPKKPRNLEEEAEDEPVYFNEQTRETLKKSEWEKRETEQHVAIDSLAKVKECEHSSAEAATNSANEAKDKNEKLAAIGIIKKRKLGRVIGGEEGLEEAEQNGAGEKRSMLEGRENKRKPTKKPKKIKLSFGDDE